MVFQQEKLCQFDNNKNLIETGKVFDWTDCVIVNNIILYFCQKIQCFVDQIAGTLNSSFNIKLRLCNWLPRYNYFFPSKILIYNRNYFAVAVVESILRIESFNFTISNKTLKFLPKPEWGEWGEPSPGRPAPQTTWTWSESY